MPEPSAILKPQIRKKMRAQRNQLAHPQMENAAVACSKLLLQTKSLIESTHIALYLQQDGELDPYPTIEALWALHKQVYLPVIEKHRNQLKFAAYHPGSEMRLNRFGIAEPSVTEFFPIGDIDIVCLPLVAFTEQGQRLGMGGGFYDRTLEKYANNTNLKKIGLAYEFQKQPQLPTETWDQSMDMIVTEKKIY